MADEKTKKINSIKITDLPETTILSDDDISIQNNETTTHKFKLSTLIQYIKNHTEIAKFFVQQETVNNTNGVAPLDSDKKIPTDNIRYGKEIGTVYQGSEGAALETTVDTHVTDNEIHIVTSERSCWNDKYTKNEIDNKFSSLETNTDWKEAVSTYNDIVTTYPTPQDGWTVNVKDTDYTYRYSGSKSKWVVISANAIPKATESIDGLLAKEDKIKIDGVETNANKYTHPSHMAYSNGLYKLVIDNLGHIASAVEVTKSDITNLGIPSSDTNTHYASKNVIGTSTATTNTTTALENGNVYLVSVENGAVTSAHQIKGTGGCTVTTDASGNILVNGANTYTLPDASVTQKGGVKIGANITVNGATISLTYDNIINALGYTPGSSTSEYVHPTTSGNKHIPSGGSSGQFLKWSADGTAVWANDNNTTYSDMTAATASVAGTHGLVPAPAAGKQGQYLRGDGTWATPDNTNNAVTQTISNTANANYRVLLSNTADDTTRTEGTRKDTNFTYNPSTNTLNVANVNGKASKAINDANGNEIINQTTSSTEPTNQKVGDYWVQEY